MATTFYSKNFQGWPPVANPQVADPESEHWHEMAMDACALLVAKIGAEQYHAWLDEIGEPASWYDLWKTVTEYARTRLPLEEPCSI